MASNLRGAPLFLRPSVVRGLVEASNLIRKGVVQVPIAPIALVDRPRASEDPRLAKANDDIESGRVAPPVASELVPVQAEEAEPEDWPDAPLPEHADPDLDRPEPPVEAAAAKVRVMPSRERIGLIRAAAEGAAVRLPQTVEIDWARVAAAHRAKPAAVRVKPARELPVAPNREACPRCGVGDGRAAPTSCLARPERPRRSKPGQMDERPDSERVKPCE